MSPKAARTLEASAARFELELSIEAPLPAVWQAIVDEPNSWWIPGLRCVSGDSEMVLDARAGGHLVERNDSGGSLLWFTVIAVEPQQSINLAGSMAPPFGGPCQTFLLIEVEEKGGSTIVRMTNSLHGHIDEGMLPSMEAGWRDLLENGLKRFVEGRG
ncbi:MAG: SRPBCC domain-containing protein [Planctomycetota bacterium]